MHRRSKWPRRFSEYKSVCYIFVLASIWIKWRNEIFNYYLSLLRVFKNYMVLFSEWQTYNVLLYTSPAYCMVTTTSRHAGKYFEKLSTKMRVNSTERPKCTSWEYDKLSCSSIVMKVLEFFKSINQCKFIWVQFCYMFLYQICKIIHVRDLFSVSSSWNC